MNDQIEKLVGEVMRLGLGAADARRVIDGRAEGLPTDRSLALVAFDVDSVQRHILASPRPITIQGASEALRAWDRDLRDGAVVKDHGIVLFAGGGTATLVVRADHASLVEKDLREQFEIRVPGATCTIARVAFSASELASGPAVRGGPHVSDAVTSRAGWRSDAMGFGACIARLHAELRRRQGEAREHPVLEGKNSRSARCIECTFRPREGDAKLCAVCRRYRDDGFITKKHWDSKRSFDEIFDGSRRIAFIKLDGKGIAAVLDRLGSMAQYRAVSAVLLDAFEPNASTLEGLGVPVDDEVREGRALRMQRTIAGGDDLLVVVPATWERDRAMGARAATDALTLALRLAERVEGVVARANLKPYFPDGGTPFENVAKIGVGAGVVIANVLPASFCFDLADGLVKSAKTILTGKPGAPRSAVDFAILHGGTVLSSSLETLRKRETSIKGSPDSLDFGPALSGDVRMTRRPYALTEYDRLLDTARQLPRERAGLYGLGRAMERPGPGLITVRYQVARDPRLRKALLGKAPLGELPRNLGDWILAKTDEGWATGIPDLLEVVSVVTPEAPAAAVDDA